MGHSKYIYNLGMHFSLVANQYAGRRALLYPSGEQITYSELNSRANRLARALSSMGVGYKDVVGLFSNKSIDALAAMIACLKIGAIYTNLDDNSPWERISKMLTTCKPVVVLYDTLAEGLQHQIREKHQITTLALNANHLRDLAEYQSAAELELTNTVNGSDPAYIMFTSGSTGFPKGAVMSHANVLNFIHWSQQTFEVTSDDVFTNVNPIYFDNSVFDFYTALFSGSTLCPITSDITGMPGRLVECVNKLRCTSWFSVPSLLVYLLTTKAISERDFPDMTRIIFGGEGFPKAKLKSMYRIFGKRARLVNVYGPTECTCICSAYDINDEDLKTSDLAPLGRLAPNFGYYINPTDQLDRNFGELYLSGPNVGLGYYNDTERTQQSFVQDPTDTTFRSIMYKTGDLVRRAGNGYLHFQGRADFQIKHMGYRIELEEIEAAFNSLDCVNEVAVVYKRLDNGLGEIIAYVNRSKGIAENEMLQAVKRIVPRYMAPKRIIVLDTLPKNRNGKIDRHHLTQLV